MRKFSIFITLLAFNLFAFTSKAQTVFVIISNQNFVGTDFFFDLNTATSSGTINLGDCDFNLPFNSANFSAPYTFDFVDPSSSISPFYSIATDKSTDGTKLIVNIQGPAPTSSTSFNNKVSVIGTTVTRIGTFKVSSITNTSGFSGLTCGSIIINGYDNTPNTFPQVQKPTICTTPTSVPLPLTLLSFSGKVQTDNNALNWTTADEKNFSRFEVQSSISGQNFKTLGEVKGLGNASTTQKYAFNDDAPSAISYYRLAMIDIDGKIEYSNVISLNRNESKLNVLRAYPSPIENILTVDFIAPKINATQLII